MAKVLNRASNALKKPAKKLKSNKTTAVISQKVSKEKQETLAGVDRAKLGSHSKLLYFLAVISGLGLLFTILGAIAIIFVFTAFSSTLPSPTKLTNRSIEQSTKIFDRNGALLYSVFNDKNRTLVTLNEVSPHLVNATLATEDADFYFHEGLDVFGIARSVYITATGQGKQGGSTLTQQVAKNALLTSDRTISRKIKDMVLALQIEKSYTKDEILQIYLNEVPYGGTTWGAEAASKVYFGKSAKELSLAEASLLAGLPQRPTYYSPFRDPEVAKNRQRTVLKLMRDRGWINRDGERVYLSEAEYQEALNTPLEYSDFEGTLKAPHFVMYVLEILRERYGEETVQNGGLNVVTSLDLDLQEEYQKIVREEIDKAVSLDVTNGGLIAIDPESRNILAMVGSKDYFADDIDGQFNVTTGLRQPGSALKPFIYLAGFTQGYGASTVIYDVSTDFKDDNDPTAQSYRPKNYGDWGFRGPMQVRYALQNSVNTTAVKMLDLVGIGNWVKLVNELGIESLYYDPGANGLALALGGGAVKLIGITNGYASLADAGVYKEPVSILGVTNHKGEALERHVDIGGKQVVDEKQVWILSDILSDNSARAAAFGTGSQLNIPGHKVAVKTGTSNDLRDNWTVGYTNDIAIGVWVGNNDNSEMNYRLASGLTGASPIWNRAMKHWLAANPHAEFVKPEGIESTWVGSISGMVPYEEKEERRVEYFVKGTEPKAKSQIFERVKICKDDEIKDKTYILYRALKEQWQDDLDVWIQETYKDDEDQLFVYMGPDFEKEKKEDRFDLDNCGDDDDDDDDD